MPQSPPNAAEWADSVVLRYEAGDRDNIAWTWSRSPLDQLLEDVPPATEAVAALAERFNRSTGGAAPEREVLVRWADIFGDLMSSAVRASADVSIVDYAAMARMQILVDGLADFDVALDWARVSLEHVTDQSAHVINGDAAIACIYRDDASSAVAYLRRAIGIAARLGETYSLAKYFGDLASAYARQAEFEEALLWYDVALAIGTQVPQFDLQQKFESDRRLVAQALPED